MSRLDEARRPFLLTHEVATLLGCSLRTVHELSRTGSIPHRRPSGTRRLLFIEAEIHAWLDGAPLETIDLPRNGRVVRPARGYAVR